MTGQQFGDQAFNFFAANDTYPSQRRLLAGVNVQNGCVSSVSNSTIVSNFNVTMTNAAISSTLQNTDAFPSLVTSCPSSYSSVPICIDSSVSPPPSFLVVGFRQALFGTPMLAGISPSNQGSPPGFPIQFFASGTGRNDTLPYTFHWNFGDGGTATCQTSAAPVPYLTPVVCVVSHAYSSVGNYSVTMTMTDVQGNTPGPLYRNGSEVVLVSPVSGGGGGGGGLPRSLAT